MSELKEKLMTILKEKEEKIVAENIKAGVTIFDIAGNYEGEKGLDTSDATAIARDLAKGKTAYVNGKKITGEAIEYATDGNLMSYSQWGDGMKYPTDDPTNRYMTFYMRFYNYDKILRWDYNHGMAISYTSLKNALGLTADKIASGEKILDLIGTYKGLDTSDATAIADDILEGKTAYINGEKVEGTLASISGVAESTATQVYVPADDSSTLYMDALSDKNGIITTDTTITVKADNELVADAIGLAPDMIRAGANILGIEGTYDSNPEDYNARFEAPAGVTSNLTAAKCIVSIESMNLDGITVTSNMFAGCESLKSLPDMDVSKVGQASTMFKNCYNLVYTPELNFNSVQYTSSMFDGCHSISYINLVSVGNRLHEFTNMFRNCYNLKQVPNVIYCNSESYAGMFANCYSLENIDFRNAKVNNAHSVNVADMCYNCTNLKEFSNMTIQPYDYRYECQTDNMFYNCTNLIKISNLNIISGTRMNNTFYNCTNLTTLENCQISIGNMSNNMFKNCVNLVNAFENGNVSLTTQRYGVYNIFENCYKLKFNNGFVNVRAYCNNGSISSTFLNCTNITSANINVTQNNTGGIYGMFTGCTNFTTANIFVTSGTVGDIFKNCPNFVSANVTLNGGTLYNTFAQCENLQTVNINIGHRISTPNLFYGCNSLTSLQNIVLNSSWNYFCGTNYMFANCANLKDVSNMQISNISNAVGMFENCTSLENFFDISIGGTYWASNMFKNCCNLTNFNNVSIYGINIYDNMFRDCKSLKSVSGLTMCQERVTRTYAMTNIFVNCTNLTDLQSFSFCWDFSGNNIFTPFGYYNDVLAGTIQPLYNLVNFGGFINYGNYFWRTIGTANNARGDLDIVAAPNLSYQSLQNIMTNVANLYSVFNIPEGETLNKPQLIRMSNQQYEKITEADILSLQDKGWNVVVHNLTLI